MRDTPPKVQAMQDEILRRMSGAERMELAFEMSMAARELSLTRLRQQHPEWTEGELKGELLRYAFLPKELPEALR